MPRAVCLLLRDGTKDLDEIDDRCALAGNREAAPLVPVDQRDGELERRRSHHASAAAHADADADANA